MAVRRSSDPDLAELVEAAACEGIAAALARLGPALDRFADARPEAGIGAYVSGTVPSEAGPLPNEGVGLDATIDQLTVAVEHGCRIGAPGFLGFVTTGTTTVGVAAQAAVAAAGGQRYLLHSFNALEWTALRWLAELCGLPAGVAGVFTSGGSTANLVALGAARQAAYERLGIDVAETGLPAHAPRGRIYASARAHRTVHRSAAVLGLGRSGVRDIPCDRAGHINVAALARALRDDVADGIVPVAVVAVAGTTDTGAVDPAADVVAVARDHGCWVHIDGAYGLIANASPRLSGLFAGIDDADSWIVDPHKWLTTPVGVGAAFVRDEAVLTRAFAEGEAAYLEGSFSPTTTADSQFDSLGGPWADQAVELSAPPRGVLVWASLLEIGRRGVRERVERHVGYARHLAALVRADDQLELMCEPDLSIVCFRFRPRHGNTDLDQLNTRLLERLRRETPFVPTSTIVDGAVAIRPCFINPRTTQPDVDVLADAILHIGNELTAE